MVPKNVPDQLVVSGIVGDGGVVSFQMRAGMARGTAFLFEIHGNTGDLTLTATTCDSMQRQELTVEATDPLIDNYLSAGLAPIGRSTPPEFDMTLAPASQW